MTEKVDGFYSVERDPRVRPHWMLGTLASPAEEWVNPSLFTSGRRAQPILDLNVPIEIRGKEVDFNFCHSLVVVTASRFNAAIESIDGSAIQRIPVEVDGNRTAYEILNVCKLVACFDEERSVFQKWSEEDSRPEKVGKLEMVVDLKIDRAAATGHDIFRVAEWPLALIISERMKSAFEKFRVTGVRYERVDS